MRIGAVITGLLASRCENAGPERVAVDRLSQIVLKARRAPAGILQASRDERDGGHQASLSDLRVAKPLEKLPAGGLGREEVAYDDVRDERHANGVDGAGHRDDG